MSQSSTERADVVPPQRAGLSPPYTLADVLEAPPVVGALAFDPQRGRVYFVVAREPEPAAECPVDAGGPLTEWVDCEPDEAVYRAVKVETLREKPEVFEGCDDVLEAVRHDRVLGRLIPESRLAPLPVELLDSVDTDGEGR
jgi:hypothetical protein